MLSTADGQSCLPLSIDIIQLLYRGETLAWEIVYQALCPGSSFDSQFR